ncbi:hypothetical protein U1Q18_025894 [Sarracenia purpurea var. burkii]
MARGMCSLVNVTSCSTGILPKIPKSDKGDNKNIQKSGDTVGKSEISFYDAPSTSTDHVFSFSAPACSLSLTNGSRDSSPFVFSYPSPVLASSNFTHQTFTNSLINVASLTTSLAAASNTNMSTSASAPFSAASIFKFGSTSLAPTNGVSTVSIASAPENTDLQGKTEKETTLLGNLASSPFGGTSFTNTASTIFSFGASSTTTANNISQGSLFGTPSGSLVSKLASPPGTGGLATVTQSLPLQFSSSVLSPMIGGASEITSFPSSSSQFGQILWASSSSSSSETNSTSTSGAATSSLLGSSWQPTKSSVFSSNTVPLSTGFSFGASSISAAATNCAPTLFGSSGASSASFFSSSLAAATASSSQSQPLFVGSVAADQMNTEDSMAEDPITASTPTMPVLGQPSISTPSSSFVFGPTAAPSTGQPFQFGSQQNQSTPQNPPLFQTSSSLDFGTGGSFSLGSGGDDKKSNRRIVKVKRKTQRR